MNRSNCPCVMFQQRAEEQGSIPSVSQEEPDEAQRINSFKQLLGSSETFLSPGENLRHRMELRGGCIIQDRAAEQ